MGAIVDETEEQESRGKAVAVRWLILILAIFLGAGIVTAAWPAETFSATDENGKLTLSNTPCTLGNWFKEWKAAHWLYKGKSYEACWRLQKTMDGRDRIVIIDSAGMVTPVDPRAFAPDEAI